MKRRAVAILPIILALLVVPILVCSIFSSHVLTSETDDGFSPINYYPDGSHSQISSVSSRSGMNFAEGDPSLLQHSEIINVVIFIYFSDEAETVAFPTNTTALIAEKFNGDSYSLFDYYRTISYGSFAVRSIFPKTGTLYFAYKDSHTRSYYEKVTQQSGTKRYDPESALLNAAVDAADDYLSYNGLDIDANDDGYVDSVSFVVSGTYSSSNWGGMMWPHAWNLDKISGLSTSNGSSSKLNGLKVDNYTFTFAGSFQIGLVSHEFGHLLGLPDLYHYGNDTNSNRLPVGYWDLMHLDCTLPQYMLSYTRDAYLGFLGPKQVKELTVGGTYSLSPTSLSTKEDVVAYKVTVNEHESVWIEYRSNATYTYDLGLPATGLIIYRVNDSVTGNTEGKYQNSRYPDEVYVYRPSCAPTSVSGLKNQELYELARAGLALTGENRISSLGSKVITSKYSSSCIYLTDGTNTGIVVTLESSDEYGATFTVDLGEYDGAYIGDSYVMGTDLQGKSVKNESYIYYGETPDVGVYVKYTSRPTAIELSDYELEYELKVCPEGQTAYAVFTDSYGERKIPFTIYIYDIKELTATVLSQPSNKELPVGGTLDLSGLVISINYRSSRAETVAYSQSNAEEWKITEGLDVNKSGIYNHVLIGYGENVTFVLSGITVRSRLRAIRLNETDSTHIFGNFFTPSFNVTGVFEDGSERSLGKESYTVTGYPEGSALGKITVSVSANEDPTIKFDTYVYCVQNQTVTSISEISPVAHANVAYGEEPDFEGGKIAVTFSDGFILNGENAILIKNYSSSLLSTYSPTKISVSQRLTMHVGSISYGVSITVLPNSSDLLSSDSPDVSVDETKKRIYLGKDVTLSALTSCLSSRLKQEFRDGEENYELAPSAFPDKKSGERIKLVLLTASGKEVAVYKIYRIGDYNGDGTVDPNDERGWIDAFLSENEYGYPGLDVNGDGKYTLTDLVILFNGKEDE